MKRLTSRRPSHGVIVAYLALFVALGGSGYAAAKLNGSQLVNRSVPAKKIKKRSLTGTEVKNGSLTGADIRSQSIVSSHLAPNSIGSGNVGDNSLTGADIAPGAIGASEVGARPGARVWRDSGSNAGKVAFNREIYDSGSLFDPAQPTRLTAPVGGIYAVTAQARIRRGQQGPGQDLTGDYDMRISLNETTTIAKTEIGPTPDDGDAFFVVLETSSLVRMSAGDFLELAAIGPGCVYTGGETCFSVLESEEQSSPILAMQWIAPL